MSRAVSAPPDVILVSSKPDAPSFRHRLLPVIPQLAARGLRAEVEKLPSGPLLLRVLTRRHRFSSASAVVLAKVKLEVPESRLMRRLCRRIVYDFDDAVYAVRPRAVGHRPRRSPRRQWRFASICRASDLVVACNETLAAEAQPFARRVEVAPTPVDVAAYPVDPPLDRSGRTVVWIGMPENLRYLDLIRPVLANLAREIDGLKLRIVCSEAPNWPELPVELVPWSETTEVASLWTADVGIMPLTDDDWSSGKCAFKILQYMAAGLPCVASRVAMNADVLEDGVHGFLAQSADDWHAALHALLTSNDHGRAMGASGRRLVEERFDRAKVAPRVADLIASLC